MFEVWKDSRQLLGASGLEAAVRSDADKTEKSNPNIPIILPTSFKIEVCTGHLLGASGLQDASQTLPLGIIWALSGDDLGRIWR